MIVPVLRTKLRQYFWHNVTPWSGSYFAESVCDTTIGMVHQYIELQNRPG
ncbi:MAG: hypothetical protein H0T78_06575 [Longispora sp.]|nr:hypothetical protein [Longispora sp. (in: high G+C Gram-positive bacteria)]